jgi:hypothetical protein
VVDMDVPQELSLVWRKDNRSPLLASFVADVQRFPDVRGVNTGKAGLSQARAGARNHVT